jgi:hypothetical protein
MQSVCSEMMVTECLLRAISYRDFWRSRFSNQVTSASRFQTQKSNLKFPATLDGETYKWRHLIKYYFVKPEENKGIAMRSY